MKPTYLTLALALSALCFSACGSDEEEVASNTISKPSNDGSVAVTTCPDDHHPHLIDMGLPSGTKWACCNMGAKTPEDYGEYYAWGEVQNETQKKAGNKYTWGSYSYYSVSDRGQVNYVDLGMDITGTKYDVAHVLWQGKWQMPTKEQFEELTANCSRSWELGEKDAQGKYGKGTGAVLKSKVNGAKIFIPASSYYSEIGMNDARGEATFWTSNAVPQEQDNMIPDMAYRVNIYNTGYKTVGSRRDWGFPIRAVAK